MSTTRQETCSRCESVFTAITPWRRCNHQTCPMREQHEADLENERQARSADAERWDGVERSRVFDGW